MKPEEIASCLAGSFRCQIEVSALFLHEGLARDTICQLQCTVVGVVHKDLMLSCCVAVE